MKYIIFENKYPVIFPDEIIHYEIDALGYTPTSAGHLTIKGNKVTVYGESESLGLKPKSEDKNLLELLIKSKQ